MLLCIDEARKFQQTRRIPMGSWQSWVHACYHEVSRINRFQCSWASLLGMTVGMMMDSAVAMENFARDTARLFHRPEERRFLLYFVALADALCGTPASVLQSRYSTRLGKSISTLIRRHAPSSVLAWPIDGARRILTAMGGGILSTPLMRDSDADFFVYLVHGYYTTSLDTAALSHMTAHRTDCLASSAFAELQARDPALARCIMPPPPQRQHKRRFIAKTKNADVELTTPDE
jgi:hypothetical protein